MKIGILGHFARNTDMCDGQTVKTRHIERALINKEPNIATVDSYRWKKHPFSFLLNIIKLVLKSDVIIMLPDAGGIKIYPYIINLFAGKRKLKIYSVVGAWLPSYLKNNKKMCKQLQKYDYILVETQTMQTQLEALGFDNAVIVPNFKDITPLREEELVREFEYPLPFCIFSRVMKEKGVTDAIEACVRVNEEYGKTVCTLDIYGPVQEEYKEELLQLCEKYSLVVEYKGVADPSQSVEILKKYYMLLFPTLLFYTEGIPGTIIDAFSAGVPVLASEWESYRDVLSESDSITYKLGDKEALFRQLKYCIGSINEIVAYRPACLKSAKKFSMDVATEMIWNLIIKESKQG